MSEEDFWRLVLVDDGGGGLELAARGRERKSNVSNQKFYFNIFCKLIC